ncbi:MAG: alkaline phosphatase [Gammaproteobacteria bacterium]
MQYKFLFSLPIALAAVCAGMPLAFAESPQQWYSAGQNAVADALQLQPNRRRAKNVILFVGDGMGVGTVTAARILEGQLRGASGEENLLSFERLPYVALSKTYNTNQQTPDSAGTMTAMMTGVKTKAGLIAVNQNAVLGDCGSAKGNELPTLLEQAETAGKATGVVTTTRLTHATPAATYAHAANRDWESDNDMPSEAKHGGCKDIARQLLEFPYGDSIEVALGGGRLNFLPRTAFDPEDSDKEGKREDGRDLTQEWLHKYRHSAYVWNKTQFDAVDPKTVKHLLGLFDPSHMEYAYDRLTDKAGEPSLAEMTAKAIDLLRQHTQGFFLMVEAGRIDHAHHAGNAFRALTDTIALSQAVQTALQKTDPRDTLIVVTADHSHVFTIAGYPTRGNPILGKVTGNDKRGEAEHKHVLALDGKPYTTVSYANGQGAAVVSGGSGEARSGQAPATGRGMDLSDVDTETESYYQQALVPLKSETHSGEDVAIYAAGPGAYLFHGVQEQNIIYHVMKQALEMPAASQRGKKRRVRRRGKD